VCFALMATCLARQFKNPANRVAIDTRNAVLVPLGTANVLLRCLLPDEPSVAAFFLIGMALWKAVQ